MSGPAPLACLEAACAGLSRVGVAVSGGGDSVAALVLAVEVLGADRVAAVTVDHGLRPGAAAEAAGVAALCARLGVAHDILRWDRPDGAGGNLMAAARAARFGLIAGWAAARVDAVVLAHTLDDQAETVLMRLLRGSGVDGLSGMTGRRRAQGLLWLRPFLGVRRAALREGLRARGIGWVEDPTNADPQYLRVRARQALAALAAMGLGPEGLAATADRLRRARAVLEAEARRAQQAMVRDEGGTLWIEAAVATLAPETRDRLFAHLLMEWTGAPYRPRLAALHRWQTGGTLAGAVLAPAAPGGSPGGGWRLWREARAVAGLEVPAGALWDGRWRAEGPDPATVIRALGQGGLAILSRQAAAGLHPHWRGTGLPAAALAGMPALWRDGRLVAAPLALWPAGWRLIPRPLAAIGDDASQSH